MNNPCSKTVLVIEDDQAIRDMMKDVLEHDGFEVATANDGGEGLDLLNALPRKPCLIILDMMMPRTNGWQFLDYQRTKPDLAGIPVVICSAYKESAKSVRPQLFVEKPVKLELLRSAVRAFCA